MPLRQAQANGRLLLDRVRRHGCSSSQSHNHSLKRKLQQHPAGDGGNRAVGVAGRGQRYHRIAYAYENLLGAGTGAIGLPKPSSAVDTSSDTSSLLNAQYLGFFYSSGYEAYNSAKGTYSYPTNGFTSVASFGFSSLPANCNNSSFGIPATDTIVLFGGDFTNNDPAASTVQANGGFGNCDFAIDFGTQDSSTNGLFTGATVYVGSNFATNTTGTTYSFPAVAIAGQLNGKYAIFLIGEDTAGSPNQAWGIYLLQSN